MLGKIRSSLAQRFHESSGTWRMSTLWFRDDLATIQYSLLRLLAVAHVERLEVAPLVLHLSSEQRGAARRRLRQLSRRLSGGTPLIAALEQTPDALSDEDVLTLRFASQSGTLMAAYDSLIDRRAAASGDSSMRIRQAIIYFWCLSLAVLLALSLLMLFIVPTYNKILEELGLGNYFGKSLWPYGYLVAVCWSLGQYFPLGLALVIATIALVWIFKPARRFRRALASRLVRPVAQLRSAHMLRMLSLAVDAGRPIPGSLSTLARYHFDRNVRAKLLYARNEVEQGAEPWNSLSIAHLLTEPESHALASSASSNTRSWLLRRLAQWKEDRVKHRVSILANLVHPALVLVFGFIVLWITVAFMGFLSFLISSLA